MNNESAKPQCNKLKAAVIVVVTAITAFFAYGYEILHPTVGIDDTEIERYVLKGWEPQIYRTTLAIIGKVIPFDKYVPYLYDVLGAVLIVFASLLFCYVLNKYSGRKISILSYLCFNVLFVSSPTICEIYIFYLHNGAGLAFVLVMAACLCDFYFICQKKIWGLIIACLCVVMAMGCYESFAVVYLVALGICMCCDCVYAKQEDCRNKFLRALASWCLPTVMAFAYRSVMAKLVVRLYSINLNEINLEAHGSSIKFWFMNNPLIICKDLAYKFIMRYILSGVYFNYIKVFLAVSVVFVICVMITAITKKKFGILFFAAIMIFSPWLFVIYGMEMSPYRVMQGLMIYVAGAGFIVCECIVEIIAKTRKKRLTEIGAGVGTAIIILFGYWQIADSIKYYRTDYEVYQSDLCFCQKLYEELGCSYDISKPIVFVGRYDMPKEYKEKTYLLNGTAEYVKLSEFMNLKNTKAFYYYCDNYGYQLYDVAHVDPLSWAAYANPSYHNAEITDFFNMHGYNISKPENPDFDEILEKSPVNVWPMEDSVVEFDDYIVVRIGE